MIARTAGPSTRSPAKVVSAAVGAVAIVGVTWLSGLAWAQTATRLELDRNDARIEIVNAGLAAEGARSILDLSGCQADPSISTFYFVAPNARVTMTIDPADASRTVVESRFVTVLRPEADTSAEGDDGDDETIVAQDATATFGRPPCAERITEADPPVVRLVQGRTEAVGRSFRLDGGEDVATLDGPIRLTRSAERDAAEVRATADLLRFDVDAGRSTLVGNVVVESDDRVSRAETLELDEDAGIAVLIGSPAVSRRGADEVSGDRLIYDLETNDVVIEGGVAGTIEIGSDAGDANE